MSNKIMLLVDSETVKSWVEYIDRFPLYPDDKLDLFKLQNNSQQVEVCSIDEVRDLFNLDIGSKHKFEELSIEWLKENNYQLIKHHKS